MPEEEYEVEATIEGVAYKNVRGLFTRGVDTLLTVTFPLRGVEPEEIREEILRIHSAFRFRGDKKWDLRYDLGERRFLRSLWKKTPYCKIKEIQRDDVLIEVDQYINLEK